MSVERTFNADEREYKNLKAVAAILTAVSPNKKIYRVEDVYFDYGQNWMWTTISTDSKWGGVQVLSPRQWFDIVTAETVAQLAECVEDVRNDKYFSDKAKEN